MLPLYVAIPEEFPEYEVCQMCGRKVPLNGPCSGFDCAHCGQPHIYKVPPNESRSLVAAFYSERNLIDKVEKRARKLSRHGLKVLSDQDIQTMRWNLKADIVDSHNTYLLDEVGWNKVKVATPVVNLFPEVPA